MDIGTINSQLSGASYPTQQQPQPEVRQQDARVQTESRGSEPASIRPAEQLVSQVASANSENAENGADKKDGVEERYVTEMLDKGISEANKKLTMTSNELQYSYHKKTRTVMVKVVDASTKEIVRELPPQKDLDAIAKMWELAGIMVDERK